MKHRSTLQSTFQQAIARLVEDGQRTRSAFADKRRASKRLALPLVALPLMAALLLAPKPASADLDKTITYEGDYQTAGGAGWNVLDAPPNRFSIVDADVTTAARGSRSAKFVFTKVDSQTTDPDSDPPKEYARTEVSRPSVGKVGEERWIGFAVKLPATWQADPNYTIVTQMKSYPDGTHWGANEPGKSPAFALVVNQGNWAITSHYDPAPLNTASGYGGSIEENFNVKSPWADDRGKWTYWVVRVRWSFNPAETDPNKKGFMQVWKNGNLLVDKTGANCYNDQQFDREPDGNGGFNGGLPIYLKQGIYKPHYNTAPYNQNNYMDGGSPDVITVYHDETRIGKANDSSYAEVMPMNLLRNPGFENNPGTVENSTLHDDYWVDETGNSLAVTGYAHSGPWSMRLGARSGGLSSRYLEIVNGVAAGEDYTLSSWGKAAASGGRGRLVVRCLDSAGNTIGGASPDGVGRFFTADFTATSYAQKSVSFRTPPGTTALRVILVNDEASTSYFYVDDVVLKRN